MLKINVKNKFKKDMKQMARRGKRLDKIQSIMKMLVHEKPLDQRLFDHALIGNYVDCRECHIEPDWLLIYRIEKETITFIRTGSHSDLFK